MKRIVYYLLLASLLSSNTFAEIVNLTVSEDTYIQRDNTGPYGTNEALRTKDSPGNAAYDRKTLVKYDLSTVTLDTFDRSYIAFYVIDVGTKSSIQRLDVYALTSSWSETTVKWNDLVPAEVPAKPSDAGGTLITSIQNANLPDKNNWIRIDVTDYLGANWETLKSEGAVSFCLMQESNDSRQSYDFASKENTGGNTPYLSLASFNDSKSSLILDGVDDHFGAGISVSAYNLNSAFTLEAWVYAPSGANTGDPGRGGFGIFGGQGTLAESWSGPYLGIVNSSFLEYGFGDATGHWVTTSATGVLTLDAWNHIALTFSAATDKTNLYLNGDLVEEKTVTAGVEPRTSRGISWIGRASTSGQYFTGKIDEVRVWNVVRTETEIEDNISEVVNPLQENNLVAYYKLDEGTGGHDTSLINLGSSISPAVLNIGETDTNIKWAGDSVTPAIGLEVSQEGSEFSWSVATEIGVKEYQVVNAATGEVVEVVVAGNGSYSVTLPEGVEAKLVVVDNSGYRQTFLPADGNIVKVVYDLKEGWNLIAMPGENADISELKDVTVGGIWAWNGAAYETTETPAACQGIWIYAPKTVQAIVTAEKSDVELSLQPGWNLVGPKENITVPEAALTVYGWNETYEQILNDGIMVQGIGYWIFTL